LDKYNVLEALIDLWRIPKEDAYRILESKEGDFIAPRIITETRVPPLE